MKIYVDNENSYYIIKNILLGFSGVITKDDQEIQVDTNGFKGKNNQALNNDPDISKRPYFAEKQIIRYEDQFAIGNPVEGVFDNYWKECNIKVVIKSETIENVNSAAYTYTSEDSVNYVEKYRETVVVEVYNRSTTEDPNTVARNNYRGIFSFLAQSIESQTLQKILDFNVQTGSAISDMSGKDEDGLYYFEYKQEFIVTYSSLISSQPIIDEFEEFILDVKAVQDEIIDL